MKRAVIRPLAFFLKLSLVMAMCGHSPSSNAEKIKIAFISPFSGNDPHTSQELWKGLEVFFDVLPEAKTKIEFVRFDTLGTVEGAIKAVLDARQSGIKILFGLPNSNEAVGAGNIVEANELLMLTPFATNVLVTEGKKRVFRTCFNDKSQADTLAKFFVNVLKKRKVIVLQNTDSLYSQGLTQQFSSTAKLLNPNVELKIVSYNNNNLALDQIAAAIKSQNIEVAFIPDHIIRGSLILQHVRDAGLHPVFLGADGFGGQDIFKTFFAGKPDFTLYYTHHWHESLPTPENKLYIKSFKKLFPGQTASLGGAMAYDGLQVLWSALKAAKFSAEPSLLARKLREGPLHLTTGIAQYTEGDNTPVRPLVVMGYKSGKYFLDRVYK